MNVSFPYMLPGWTAEKVDSSYVMISPRSQRSVSACKMATDPVRSTRVMIVVTVARTMMDRRILVIARCVRVCWTRWVWVVSRFS